MERVLPYLCLVGLCFVWPLCTGLLGLFLGRNQIEFHRTPRARRKRVVGGYAMDE